MKRNLFYTAACAALLCSPTAMVAQAPNLGVASTFVLYSTAGAVTNTGTSLLTGNVGSNSGSSTGFGNVNGNMLDGGPISAAAYTDLLSAYQQLDTTTATFFPASLLGNGATLPKGVYAIGAAATLENTLTLDAKGNPNAVFIFKIGGAFATGANAKVILTNGAKACNVFWKVEGMVSMAAGTKMCGTIVANNAAINMNANDTLQGRALSISGAINVDGVFAYLPTGCGSPVLLGPPSPVLASTECYALFSVSGAVTNAGTSTIMGDVGSNSGLTTGFDPLLVKGNIHPIPDNSTAQCAADLGNLYLYLNSLPYDINLLYPAQFGRNLVLTPHTYLLDAATVFTDTLYLDAQGQSNAVFVIQINGALTTSTYSKVLLINGAEAKNVFWKVEGAASINDYSVFCGTIVCNNGALGTLSTGVTLNGRGFSTVGTILTADMATTMKPNCSFAGVAEPISVSRWANVYPNPATDFLAVEIPTLEDLQQVEFTLYDVLGNLLAQNALTQTTTCFDLRLAPGVYYYTIIVDTQLLQAGKVVAR